MRANEFLSELADKPYEMLFTQHKDKGSRYDFATDDGQEYMVLIKPTMIQPAFQNNALVVNFALRKEGEYVDTATGAAGSSALRVFTTVLAALKDSLAFRTKAGLDIQYIVFAGRTTEPTRIKLYSRMARNINRYLPGWKFSGEKGSDGSTEFYVTRDMRANEIVTENLDFIGGDCTIMAVALHKLSGLPIYGLLMIPCVLWSTMHE